MENLKNIVFTSAVVVTVALVIVLMATPPVGADASISEPVPQSLVTVATDIRCIEDSSLLTITVSNDYWETVSIDFAINGEDRADITIPSGEAIFPEVYLGQSHASGIVQVTVTYNDGGPGIFQLNEPYSGNDCSPAEVPVELTPDEEPYAIERDNDDVYVTSHSTVATPKPIAFTG